MGGFFGTGALGRGFFGLTGASAVVPPPVGSFIIQAGGPGGFPGSSGISNILGWYGFNNGIAGPQVVGSTISGQANFDINGNFGFGDGVNAPRIPFVGPYFLVYSGDLWPQNAFNTVVINGTIGYTTNDANLFFDNGGGCGPTYWIWKGTPAGLVVGQQYAVDFEQIVLTAGVSGTLSGFNHGGLLPGPAFGAVNPNNYLLNSIVTLDFDTGTGNVTFSLAGNQPQALFQQLNLIATNQGLVRLNSGLATYSFDGVNNITNWVWNVGGAALWTNGTNYPVFIQ